MTPLRSVKVVMTDAQMFRLFLLKKEKNLSNPRAEPFIIEPSLSRVFRAKLSSDRSGNL